MRASAASPKRAVTKRLRDASTPPLIVPPTENNQPRDGSECRAEPVPVGAPGRTLRAHCGIRSRPAGHGASVNMGAPLRLRITISTRRFRSRASLEVPGDNGQRSP